MYHVSTTVRFSYIYWQKHIRIHKEIKIVYNYFKIIEKQIKVFYEQTVSTKSTYNHSLLFYNIHKS